MVYCRLSPLARFGPALDATDGDGHGIGHIQGKAEHLARSLAIFGVIEGEQHIPAVAIHAAVGAFFHLNGVELAAVGDRLGKGGRRLKGVGNGKVEGPIAAGLAHIAEIVVDPLQKGGESFPQQGHLALGGGNGGQGRLHQGGHVPAVHPPGV